MKKSKRDIKPREFFKIIGFNTYFSEKHIIIKKDTSQGSGVSCCIVHLKSIDLSKYFSAQDIIFIQNLT